MPSPFEKRVKNLCEMVDWTDCFSDPTDSAIAQALARANLDVTKEALVGGLKATMELVSSAVNSFH
jgi:hypothetical protein